MFWCLSQFFSCFIMSAYEAAKSGEDIFSGTYFNSHFCFLLSADEAAENGEDVFSRCSGPHTQGCGSGQQKGLCSCHVSQIVIYIK